MVRTTRRQFVGIVLSSAVLLIAQARVVGQDTPTAPLKVLFIGNSYTSVNDLPALIAGLAEAAGGRKIEVDRHLVGGCTLEKHVKDQKEWEGPALFDGQGDTQTEIDVYPKMVKDYRVP